jgi:hypothetical protein
MDQYGARLERYDVRRARAVSARPLVEAFSKRLAARPSWRILTVMAAVLTLAVSLNMLSQGLWDVLVAGTTERTQRAIWGLVLLVFSAGSLWLIYRMRYSVLSSDIAQSVSVPPRPIAVMALSPLPADPARRSLANEFLNWAEDFVTRIEDAALRAVVSFHAEQAAQRPRPGFPHARAGTGVALDAAVPVCRTDLQQGCRVGIGAARPFD